MSWIAIAGIARRFWWAIPIAALTIALYLTRLTLADRTATLAAERQAWTDEIQKAEKQRADDQARWARQSSDALTTYTSALADRQPLIIRSTDTVREYAQSDAGRVLCRDADRVRAIDNLDAALAQPAGAAGSSGEAVRADAAAPPAER